MFAEAQAWEHGESAYPCLGNRDLYESVLSHIFPLWIGSGTGLSPRYVVQLLPLFPTELSRGKEIGISLFDFSPYPSTWSMDGSSQIAHCPHS